MAAAPPYMKLYVADYDADTAHLSALEDGVYWRLLRAMWRAGGRLPRDEARLARIARVTAEEWAETWPAVRRFLTLRGGHFVQRRMQREIDAYAEYVKHQSKAGKASATDRANKNNGQTPNAGSTEPQPADEPPVQPESNQSQSQSQSQSPKKARARGKAEKGIEAPIPEDWPDPGVIHAQAERVRKAGRALSVVAEAEAFKDHAVAVGRRLVDWDAGFRTWIGKSLKAAPPAPRNDNGADPGETWRRRVAEFTRNGHWNVADWGPRPGADGCEVPADILGDFPLLLRARA